MKKERRKERLDPKKPKVLDVRGRRDSNERSEKLVRGKGGGVLSKGFQSAESKKKRLAEERKSRLREVSIKGYGGDHGERTSTILLWKGGVVRVTKSGLAEEVGIVRRINEV